MEIRIEGQQESTPVNNTPEATLIPDGVMMTSQIGDMLNIDSREMSGFKDKINTLIEYAKYKTDDHSPEGLKWAIRSLGTKLGTPPLGERLVNYLHIYAKLYVQGKQIEERKNRFLKGDSDD